MTAIANAGGGTTITASTQLSLAGVTASGDIQARDLVATRELHVDGAAICNSTLTVAGTNVMTSLAQKQNLLTTSTSLSLGAVTTSASSTLNGLRVSGGQGQNGTGASLRVTGTGDLVYNTNALYFGGNSVDTQLFELSWLGFNHFYRANTSTAWTQSMGISSTGVWTFYRGYGAASDRSLKGDPQDASMEDCMTMLRRVSAKTYSRLDLPDSGPRLGFIAQEIDAACPSAWSNLVGSTQYKWSGNEEGDEIRTLDYARLTAMLWQCTRNLVARVEALEARLAQ